MESKKKSKDILNCQVLAPSGRTKPSQLVVLLHGYGANGADLMDLASRWQEVLPDAVFVAPDAPNVCEQNSMGFEWFSMRDQSPTALYKGATLVADTVNQLIDDLLKKYKLGANRLGLTGFSQGTMMALHVGLRRENRVGAIVGYSGALLGPEKLAAELKSRPPVMLIHGESDMVVPVNLMARSHQALQSAGVVSRARIQPGLDHAIDPRGTAIGGQFLKDQFEKVMA